VYEDAKMLAVHCRRRYAAKMQGFSVMSSHDDRRSKLVSCPALLHAINQRPISLTKVCKMSNF
jgi:hypothetical protein